MKYLNIVSLLVLFFQVLPGGTVKGQQDAMYSQYMFNQLAYNPAYAGSREAFSSVFLLRRQWVSLDGSPTTGSFYLHTPSRNLRHGFGFSAIHDRLGITRQNYLSASYAFRIPLMKGTLSLGLRGGITHFSNLFSELNPLEVEPLNPGTDLSMLLPRAGAGIYYSLERFYLGFSAPNILTPTYRFKAPMMGEIASKQERHFFGTFGFVVPLGENVDLRPSFVAKYVNNSPFQLDMNLGVLFNKVLWVGAGYRTGDAMVGMLEFNTKGGMRVGYAYDYTLSNLSAVSRGSHEIMFGFDLGLKKSNVVSPRFF